MKIILNEDVYNLGEEGDVREVANGYARNFLLPQGLAVAYNRHNLSIFESRKAAIEKRKEEKRKAALSLKEKLNDVSLTVKMPAGETGKLFGSVNNAVIAEALEKEGITVERKKIEVASSSIKMIGTYTVMVKLYSGEIAKIDVTVASADGKAEAAQAKKIAAAQAKKKKLEDKDSAKKIKQEATSQPNDVSNSAYEKETEEGDPPKDSNEDSSEE